MQTILLSRTQQVPTPEQVIEALRREGYKAYVEAKGGNPKTSLTVEIRYTANRLPIVIHFNHDLIDRPDEGDPDDWEWIEEAMPDANIRKGVRRFVYISALENVDKKALQVVVDYLRVQTDATLISQEQVSKL